MYNSASSITMSLLFLPGKSYMWVILFTFVVHVPECLMWYVPESWLIGDGFSSD